MQDIVNIAAVQIDIKIGAKQQNLEKILQNVRNAARQGADLIVFPECALPGYVFSSREEALPYMEPIPGPTTDEISAICRGLSVYVVFGLLEQDGHHCFNAAVLTGPKGFIGKYRKSHLPFLGIDRFLDSGNEPFSVFETPIGNIGMLICYDCNFPESARVLALAGADILALPTNWPEGRGKVPNYVVVTRAFENKVHIVAADRVGIERGAKFIGNSKIVNAWGDTLAQASTENEEIICGKISLAEAREKHVIIKPGEFEANFIGDRKPWLYNRITELPKN